MSEVVPVHMQSREAYDSLYQDRVRTQKLARRVIYTLMLEIEGDDRRSGQVTVELPRVPVFTSYEPHASSAVEVSFMDDDAQPVFQLSGIVKNDELYLVTKHLVLLNEGFIMNHGYFLSDENDTQISMERELSLSGSSSIGFSL